MTSRKNMRKSKKGKGKKGGKCKVINTWDTASSQPMIPETTITVTHYNPITGLKKLNQNAS